MNSDFRRGLILPLVLVVLLVFGSLAILYFQFGSFARYSVSRFEHREYARRFAAAALDEAVFRFQENLVNRNGPEYRWLTGKEKTGPAQDVPLVCQFAERVVPHGLKAKVAAVRITRVACQTNNRHGKSFHGCEQIGTLEFQSVVELERGKGEKAAGCLGSRHHEYRIAAIVTPLKNGSPRTSYTPGFPLDYNLLVRHGEKEFVDSNGHLLHPDSRRLLLLPEANNRASGKVYFGDGPGKACEEALFANVNGSLREILPPTPTDLILDKQDCMTLFPGYPSDSPFWSVPGLRGIISHRHLPITPPLEEPGLPGSDRVEGTRKVLLNLFDKGSWKNDRAPIRIETANRPIALDPAACRRVMEGALKQRFFRYVFFRFDFPGNPSSGIQDQIFECLPPSLCQQPETIRFAKGLEALRERKKDPRIATCTLDTSAPYGKMDGTDATPADFGFPNFFHSSGKRIPVNDDAFIPYDHWEIWNKGFADPKVLETLGFLDQKAGILRPRGIVRIAGGDLTIGDPQTPDRTFKAKGSGVWFANRITLYAGIEKENPEDVLVLMAYPGTIRVKTSKKIQASLIAVNDKGVSHAGAILGEQPMHVEGAVVVDRLRLQDWTVGEHRITYDAALRPEQDLYAADVSPVPVFQSFSESE